MLDQRLSTIPHHQWISKLFGYDFKVEYKPGKLNTVADALSRRDGDPVSAYALSAPSFAFYDQLKQEIDTTPDLTTKRADIAAGRLGVPWSTTDGLVLRSNRVVVPASLPLLPTVLNRVHAASHEGTQKTLHRLRATFYIEYDRRLVTDHVHACVTCQRNKVESLHPAGLLQPLHVPSRV